MGSYSGIFCLGFIAGYPPLSVPLQLGVEVRSARSVTLSWLGPTTLHFRSRGLSPTALHVLTPRSPQVMEGLITSLPLFMPVFGLAALSGRGLRDAASIPLLLPLLRIGLLSKLYWTRPRT